jgi:uncharacterized protein (DUF58 family)
LSPTRRAAIAFAVVAGAALLLPPALVVLLAVALATAVVVDALAVRAPIAVERTVPSVLSRGVPGRIEVNAGNAFVRQPAPPDLHVDLDQGTITATRRGRHRVPPVAVRRTGPLGLGRWDRTDATQAGSAEVVVYPDLHLARRLALALRKGQLADAGERVRGPLGLGTEFESIRDYRPDDDIRQVNWRATVRLQRPMSNQYRVEQDRDVICLVDAGRLMAAPVGDGRTRMDTALDAVAAVSLAADELGDRCGVVAFDRRLRRQVRPKRLGSAAVIAATFDLEPTDTDSDYDLAFRVVGGMKRGLVLVLTDLLDESAARPLVEAVPVLAKRHAVVVASASDPDLQALLRSGDNPYEAAVAVDVLDARHRVAARLEGAGATVIEASPRGLPAACVAAYVRLKARARL